MEVIGCLQILSTPRAATLLAHVREHSAARATGVGLRRVHPSRITAELEVAGVPFSLVLVSLTAKGLPWTGRPLAVKVGIWVLKARAKGLETYCGSHGSSHLATVFVSCVLEANNSAHRA